MADYYNITAKEVRKTLKSFFKQSSNAGKKFVITVDSKSMDSMDLHIREDAIPSVSVGTEKSVTKSNLPASVKSELMKIVTYISTL